MTSSFRVVQAPSPVDIYKSVLTENYANFSGRARRAEYWWFVVMNLVVVIGLWIVTGILANVADALGVLGVTAIFLYYLAILIPSLAVTVRRLHDTDKSGWMILIGLIPIVGAIILLVFYFTDSSPLDNQYGPSPKYVP